jgi:hypothetical protein
MQLVEFIFAADYAKKDSCWCGELFKYKAPDLWF